MYIQRKEEEILAAKLEEHILQGHPAQTQFLGKSKKVQGEKRQRLPNITGPAEKEEQAEKPHEGGQPNPRTRGEHRCRGRQEGECLAVYSGGSNRGANGRALE